MMGYHHWQILVWEKPRKIAIVVIDAFPAEE